MKRISRVLLISLMATPLILPAALYAKTTTLRAVSYLPSSNESTVPLKWLSEKVDKQSNGALKIDWVGGPEVIPGREQPEAVRNGVIDILFEPTALYKARLPEAFPRHLWDYNAMEDRKDGYFDWIQPLYHEKMNSHYLMLSKTSGTVIGLNVKIARPQEIKGLRLIAVGYGVAAVKGLGGVPQAIPTTDRYSAFERGVVDGGITALSEYTTFGYTEVVKYFVDYTFFTAGNLALMVNLDKWNKLAKNLQDILIKASIEVEEESHNYFSRRQVELRQEIIDKGVKPIKFSEEDGKWYLNNIRESGWRAVKSDVTPETYNILRKFGVK